MSLKQEKENYHEKVFKVQICQFSEITFLILKPTIFFLQRDQVRKSIHFSDNSLVIIVESLPMVSEFSKKLKGIVAD
jgi:hypothetical protein